MHHFLTYNRKTGAVTGHFISSTNQFLPKPLSTEDENIEVQKPEQLEILRALDLRSSRIFGRVKKGKLQSFKAESIYRGRVVLTTDLKDLDGDGVVELPADGTSVVRITATLMDYSSKVLSREKATVRFQVSRGALSDRRIAARGGRATVELRSIPETIRTQVTATAEGFEPSYLSIEFIPEAEYSALMKRRK